jgi:hypothetical protein
MRNKAFTMGLLDMTGLGRGRIDLDFAG